MFDNGSTPLFWPDQLKLFLPISSSWVKIRLNSKNLLPCLELGYYFFMAPQFVLILHISLTKFVGKEIDVLGYLEVFFHFSFLMAPSFYLIEFFLF